MSAPDTGIRTAHGSRAEQVLRIIEDCVRRRENGEDLPDVQLVAAHPELMPEIEEELAGLRLIQRARVDVEEASAVTSPSLSIGRTLADPLATHLPGYEVVREIHRGGQGVVYEAVQRSTKRTVAVKVLLGGILADRRAQWRFEREVDLIAALKHPHIVVIHDSGVAEGNYFYAMDYVRGEPLDTHVRMTQPSVRQMVRLFRNVCDAVAHAHARGIIHRDLKPSNVLVGQDGHPYVVDFGLAKILADGLKETKAELVSVAGSLLGTIAYMAPEQTQGDSDLIDTRTDVYTLGVMLYRLVTGVHPYEVTGDLSRILKTIQTVDPNRASRLSRAVNSELDAIILKAMEKEPNRRYQSAAELTQDLDAWLDGRPIAAKSASTLYLARKIVTRHTYASMLVTAVCVAIVSSCTLGLRGLAKGWQAESAREQTQRDADYQRRLLSENPRIKGDADQLAFGWFLAEWYAGHDRRAREICDTLSRSSSEYAPVASFLLSDRPDPQQLRRDVGQRADLAEFALGERALRDQDTGGAQRHFQLAHSQAQTKSVRQLLEARLMAGSATRPGDARQ